MARSAPVTGLEQHRLEDSDLGHLAGHAVDLDEIAGPNAVWSEKPEPSEEPDDEILERDRESRAGEAEKRAEIARWSKDHE